jgi:hypothetical protein
MKDNSMDLLALRGRVGQPRPASPLDRAGFVETDSDEEECLGFGYLRGIRDRGLSLELRFADGNRVAYPYSWLGPMTYNPSAGILLKFVGDLVYLVLLEGSNLNALVNDSVNLYDRGIQRHRVTWVREMTRQQLEKAGEADVTIERIRALSHRPDEEPQQVEWLQPFLGRTDG